MRVALLKLSFMWILVAITGIVEAILYRCMDVTHSVAAQKGNFWIIIQITLLSRYKDMSVQTTVD